MTQAKHTPLPWKVISDQSVQYHYIYGDKIVAEASKRSNMGDVGKSDAAFIVRACNSHYDLLELARQIALAAEHNEGIPADILRGARAAIAKVEGGAQ